MAFNDTIQRLIDNGAIETSLRRNSTDTAAVKVMQEGLHNLGFGEQLKWSQTGADGDYGPGTAKAVKLFAQRNDTSSDGNTVTAELGRLMIKRYNFLDELRHLRDIAEDPTLLQSIFRGSPHQMPITVLQSTLHELGYDKNLNWERFGADGDYGRSTTAAVKAFARDNGLSTDGESITLDMIKIALARFEGFFGDAWYEESPMVVKESLSISDNNQQVQVSDHEVTQTFRYLRRGGFNGIYTVGTQKPIDFIKANRAMLRDRGLTDSAMNVMLSVSENEGNLDAINAYDNAIMTFGMFQWTIGVGQAEGELPALLKKIKLAAPETFEKHYGRNGLDVTEKTGTKTGYFTLHGNTLRKKVSKEALRSPTWAFYLWKSGQDPVVQSIEVQHALSRINTFYRSSGYQVDGHDIADVITSEYGIGLVLDNHVNRPGYIKRCLQKAVEQAGLIGSNPKNWDTAQENAVIEVYLKIRETFGRFPMTHAANRAKVTKKYVDQGVISNERGSFMFGGS